MATLTAAQIADYATKAGFPQTEINTAVGVALAESSGNPKSHNDTPPDNSYGLWQINMIGSLGPARRKQFGISSNDALFDPATNAKAAYTVWKGSGWKAWTTYTSGAYKKYVPDKTLTGGDVTPATAAANPVLSVGSALNAFGATFLKGFENLGGIIFAVALIVVGFIILSRNTSGGKAAIKAVKLGAIL